MIRDVSEADYISLVELYKNFFSKHNIFQKNNEEIISYLKEQAEKDQLLVYEEESKIKGAMYLVKTKETADGSHKVWKFRHFAFENEDIAKKLLNEGEKRIKEQSQTSKIELTIAESEPGIEFYKKNGYEQEGALKNHYRWGEICFVLGKSFP